MSESQPGQSFNPSSSDPDANRADREDAERVAASPFLLSQDTVTDPDTDATGGNPPGPAAPPAPAYEHLGELPSTYGTQSVYVVAYDPRQLFVYWDVDWSATPGAVYALHVCRADGEIENELGITAADAGHYVPVGVPGGTYFVELGTRGRDGSWHPVAHSGRVTMPPEGLAGEDEPKFATLPFHLSFQRLLELIQGAMGTGEDLTAALARLQHGDRAGMRRIAGALNGIGNDQMHALEELLGHKFSVNSVGDTDSGVCCATGTRRWQQGRSAAGQARPTCWREARAGARTCLPACWREVRGERGAFVGGDDRTGRRDGQRVAFVRCVRQRHDAAGVRRRHEQRDAFVVRGAARRRRERGLASGRSDWSGRQ